ncbi:alpha-2,8-polysialyltransferase family protein [Vibrio alginolyticus]|uniref:alpha-2,8-polysialyltransferase family protein n=1 Tax=Vibrio alginolyticus TaxID=663 RepID=UPI00215C0E1F|nr:alpha-2,8-polysialyltransferase family protein [Vibrio alginolyticus]MCS0000078.1 alpha-2,8-polysialyltransferase family protein [Vibrio alginolyticus]
MNLFVVAQFGQLIHNEAVIKRDRLTNNKLVILYTKANLIVPEKIKNEVNDKLFGNIQLIELPINPNSLNIDNINKIYDIYKSLLQGVDNLYISSFERHYNILNEIALRKGIRTHLIEEGLGTYKFATREFSFNPPTKKDSLIRALNYSGLSSNVYYPFLKAIYRWTNDMCSLPYQIYKALRNSTKSEYSSYQILKDLSDERSAFLGYAKDFQSINLAYPKAVSHVFNPKENKELNTYSMYEANIDLSGLISQYGIDDSDILYLSQVFNIPSDYYAEAILKIIQEQLSESKGKCFIKFHPKDKQDFIKFVNDKVDEMGLSERIIVIEESDFPIEALIKECQFDKVLAISSTALVYANQLSHRTKCISITNTLINDLGTRCPAKARKLILEHTEMLAIFDHIEFN